jgi:hypothetical protein
LFKTLHANNQIGIGLLEYTGAGYLYKGAGGIIKYITPNKNHHQTNQENK